MCFVYIFLILLYYFFKIKNLLQFTFEKITCCAKREKKNNLLREKIPAAPPPPLDVKWSVPYVTLTTILPLRASGEGSALHP